MCRALRLDVNGLLPLWVSEFETAFGLGPGNLTWEKYLDTVCGKI